MSLKTACDGRRFLIPVLVASSFFLAVTPVPASVTISSAATQNMSCVYGICSPTASKAALNVDDLQNLLQGGSVTVRTTGSGEIQANDIVAKGAVSWTSSTTLSLDAYRAITVEQSISVDGQGGVSLTTDDGGKDGALSFGPKGHVIFSNLTSQVLINGSSYTLVDSVPHLASAVASNPDGNYAFANDYDSSQDGTYSHSPIPTALTGNVQGLGNTIFNLSIDHPSSQGKPPIGLFETVSTTGSIKNLRLHKIRYLVENKKNTGGTGGLVEDNSGYLYGDEVTGSINSRGEVGGLAGVNESSGQIISSSADVRINKMVNAYTGGLVAFNDGAISLSHASGSVLGIAAGGLVSENAGSISLSFATGAVNGSNGGGLVGENVGSIKDSYSTGSITSAANDGGFVGDDSSSNAPVSTSYSIGGVVAPYDGGFACTTTLSNVTSDYWDTDTSETTYPLCEEQNISSGITGLSTAQLQSGLPSGFSNKIWAENPKVNGGFPYLISNPPPK